MSEQGGDGDFERGRNFLYHLKRWISSAPFYPADIRGMKTRLMSQLLL